LVQSLIKGPKLLLIMIRFKSLIEGGHIFVIKVHFLIIYKNTRLNVFILRTYFPFYDNIF